MPSEQQKKRGPKPETLKAEGVDWEDAVAHALKKAKLKESLSKKGGQEAKAD